MLERIYHRNSAILGNGLHVLIVTVPRYVALFAHEPLTSADFSYDHLARFWSHVGSIGEANPEYVFTPPLVRACGAKLGEAAEARALQKDILDYLRDLAPSDTLIVHWIGHGSYLRRHSDHVLYLPNLQSPDDLETLEGFWLKRFTDWSGANCRAGVQLFLFDCCSTRPHSDQHVPEPFPRFIEDPPRGPKQFIVVGSGFDRAARGRDGEPSIFTTCVIDALTRYAADSRGDVSTGRNFVTVLAALAKAEWITRGYPDFPRRVLRQGTLDWVQEFVQEVQPFCRHFTSQTDLRIATIANPRVHCCVTLVDRKELKCPCLETEPGLPLKRHRYLDADDPQTRLWAWIGDLPPQHKVRGRLLDDGQLVIGMLEGTAFTPVMDVWFDPRWRT